MQSGAGPCRQQGVFSMKASAASVATVRLFAPAVRRGEDSRRGTYGVTVLLPAGRYEYTFIVNGARQTDPACPTALPNEHGTTNSVVEVR